MEVDSAYSCKLRRLCWIMMRRWLWVWPLFFTKLDQQCVYGLLWGLIGGVDGVACEPGVEGTALCKADLGCFDVGEDGACDVLKDAAVEEGGERSVEEDGEGLRGLLDEETVGEAFGGSATEGDDYVMEAEGGGERGGFKAAEARFPFEGEDFCDGGAGALLKVGVEVQEGPAETGGEKSSDGRLASTHETGEDEAVEIELFGEREGREGGWLRDGLGRGRHGFSVV